MKAQGKKKFVQEEFCKLYYNPALTVVTWHGKCLFTWATKIHMLFVRLSLSDCFLQSSPVHREEKPPLSVLSVPQ